MLDFRLGNFNPVVSELVVAEVEDAPDQVQGGYAELSALGAEVILRSSGPRGHLLSQGRWRTWRARAGSGPSFCLFVVLYLE